VDVGCWIFDIGYWTLRLRSVKVLDVGDWRLAISHWLLAVVGGCEGFGVLSGNAVMELWIGLPSLCRG
jgi:hypothetical protein